MTSGSELYLVLILVAFVIFAASLAYCSIDEARFRHRGGG